MRARTAPLGQLCEMDRRGLRPDDSLAADLPFVGVENVAAGTGVLNLDTASRVGVQKSTSFQFDERHVLYGKLRPYLNKVAAPGFVGRCSTELIPLLPGDEMDRDFLAYLLRRKETAAFAMASATGTRMPRADMKALLSMPVPFPSLEEQRRIVAVLNQAAKIERLRTRAAERLREFLPALFLEMFGDPIRNPRKWKVAPLGSVCTLVQYGTSKKADVGMEGTPILRMGNVTHDGYIHCADMKHVDLSSAEKEKYSLSTGDILFNRTNSRELVGKTGLWDGRFEAVAASYFIRLRMNMKIVRPSYIWAFMNNRAMKMLLYRLARGAIGQANINSSELKLLTVLLPPLAIQAQFERLLIRTRKVANAFDSSQETAAALSASLMDRLLEELPD